VFERASDRMSRRVVRLFRLGMQVIREAGKGDRLLQVRMLGQNQTALLGHRLDCSSFWARETCSLPGLGSAAAGLQLGIDSRPVVAVAGQISFKLDSVARKEDLTA
jgi:hypothetical protein